MPSSWLMDCCCCQVGGHGQPGHSIQFLPCTREHLWKHCKFSQTLCNLRDTPSVWAQHYKGQERFTRVKKCQEYIWEELRLLCLPSVRIHELAWLVFTGRSHVWGIQCWNMRCISVFRQSRLKPSCSKLSWSFQHQFNANGFEDLRKQRRILI